MRPSLCRSCLASILKLLSFLQAFSGVSILIYSVWVLNHWSGHRVGDGFSFDFDKLPAPWFVCSLMGIGALICLITFIGYVATEAINRCCLCFYAVLASICLLLEAALVGDLVLDKHWKENLPYDSTGELERLRAFIEDNMDICKWVGLTLVVIQALSLLLAMVLRAMIPTRRVDYDSDDDFVVFRRPLLIPQGGPTYVPTTAQRQGYHPDSWSSHMRQKYGLNQN